MDISGLTSAAGGFGGFGGTSSLPASVQSALLRQTQALTLLPPVSPVGLGGSLDIYAAVGQQTLGALSGRSALELSRIILAGREGSAAGEGSPGDSVPAESTAPRYPRMGSTLDAILKEDGFVPKENPYEFRKDFFADRVSLGGNLNSLG
jgi:hypothetical protein